MDFLGIGVPEVIVIIILALIFIGPRDLPKVAARFAKFLRELRMMSEGFRTEWQRELNAAGKIEGLKELKDELVTTKRALQEASQEVRSIGRDIQTSMTIDLDELEAEADGADGAATKSSKTSNGTKDTTNIEASAANTDTVEADEASDEAASNNDEDAEYVIGSSESSPAPESASNDKEDKDKIEDKIKNEVETETLETDIEKTVSAERLEEKSEISQPNQADLDDLELQTIHPPEAVNVAVNTGTEASSLATKSASNGDDQTIVSPPAETISPSPVVSSPASDGIDVGDIEEKPQLDDEVKVTSTQSATTEETASSE